MFWVTIPFLVMFRFHLQPLHQLEDTDRFSGLFLAPVEGFGLGPGLLFPHQAKKEFIILFWLILGHI